jgi:hypothetical protein
MMPASGSNCGGGRGAAGTLTAGTGAGGSGDGGGGGGLGRIVVRPLSTRAPDIKSVQVSPGPNTPAFVTLNSP